MWTAKKTPPSGCVFARHWIPVPLMELELGGGGNKNAAYPQRNDRENNVLCGSGGAVIVFSRRRSRLNNCKDTRQDRRGYTGELLRVVSRGSERHIAGLKRQHEARLGGGGGMARRQGGSFNSILGREEIASLSASPSSEQQRATGKQLARRRERKHTIIKRSRAYFSRAWLSDGTGVPLPLGNIVLCGWTPAFSFFFPRYFICQIIAAATLSRSNHTPAAQPDDSTEPGPEGKGGATDDGCRGWPMRERQ